MKKIGRIFVLLLALSAMLCMTAFAEDAIEITDVNGDIELAAGSAEQFTATYSNAVDGGRYLILMIQGAYEEGTIPTINAETILYIDQMTATGTSLTFDNVYPKEVDESVIILTGTGMDPTVLGHIKPPKKNDVTVTAVGDIGYSVSGQVVTVDHEIACKVGYLNEGAYVAITPVANGDGTYSFTAPAGVSEVLLIAKGDASGDGNISAADKTLLARALLLETHAAYRALSAQEAFAVDLSNDGSISAADKTVLARALLLTSHAAYKALEW